MVSDVERDGRHSLRADLLQSRFSRLRETASEHVAPERVETPDKVVTEAAVAPCHQYVAVGVVTYSLATQDAIKQLVDDDDDTQRCQCPQQQPHVLSENVSTKTLLVAQSYQ